MKTLVPTLHHHHYRPLLHNLYDYRLSPLSLSLNTHLSLSKISRLFPFNGHHHHYHRRFSFDMAQKREKEETELKVPETITLCTPTSIPAATSKISGSDDHRSSSPVRSDLKPGAVVDSRLSSGCSPNRPDLHQKPRPPAAVCSEDDSNKVKRREINRCSGCRRKVGLMGFRCRCGEMFCADHRYSDRHDCSYDYKAAGREAIARENPVVRAAKILKV